ncbi:MAG: AI-2E family transporter [Candidatus Pacebacteria bacterium]|nr:AI-2E family transporter [Candidatus Paceibacterota bacterium]
MFNFLKKKRTLVEISPSIVIFTVSFIGLLYFLFRINNIILLFFMSFILMVALSPAVSRLEKLLRSRLVSIIIVYFLLIAIVVATLSFLLPPLVNELLQFLRLIDIPYLQNYISQLKFTATEINELANNLGGSVNTLFDVVTSTFRTFFTFLTLLVISFYLLIDQPRLHLKIGWLTQKKKHKKIAREFLESIEDQLGGWIRGQVILMVVVGLITYIGLAILQVSYALPLALLAGMLEILPNLGPTLAAVPAIVITYFNQGGINALMVLIFYIIVQQLENNLIVPKIMQKNANVNPLISILSILTGFQLYGVIGGLLAVPIYILLRTIYSFWRKYKKSLTPDWS